MRAIMDSGEYLYMAIPIIKQRDLGGYKKIKRTNDVVTWIQNIRTHENSLGGINTSSSPSRIWLASDYYIKP